MKPIYFLIAFLLTGLHYQSISQKKASQYDLGKMWTFENPPKDWFKETYNLDMKDDWFNSVRKSSLRFASWCSASFISCLLYTSPSPRDRTRSRMPSSA